MSDLNLPPGPPPVKNIFQLIRTFRAFQHDALGMLMNLHESYGDTYYVLMGAKRQFITRDPELIRETLVTQSAHFGKDKDYTNPDKGMAMFLGNGLVTSNGDFWKRQRKLVAPALHAKRIEAYAQTMVDYTLEQLKNWRDNTRLDISREMNHLTMRIVARSLFNTEVQAQAKTVAEAMEIFQKLMNDTLVTFLPSWVPIPLMVRARRAKRQLDDLVYGMIAERRASGDDKGDLLSMLLLAEDEDGNHMTDEQARDEIVTLFLAGHETTANTLNWTWMLLAQHPEVEAKLHAELDSVLGDRPPALADLKKLPYTEMVIKESMRLYPPAWIYSRAALDNVKLGRFDVTAGDVVAINAYGAHRNPNLWDEPNAFIPERFNAENEAKIPRYAYVPFGGGPRVCIGNSFAMMEAQLLLATIAQRFRLTLNPGQIVETSPQITLNPKGGLPMTVYARVQQPARTPQPELVASV